jgi:hypothetical protein
LFGSRIRGEERGFKPLLVSKWEVDVQDDVKSKRGYGLDVGQDQEEELNGRVTHTDCALDKIGHAIQTLANLLVEIEKEKNKNASLTSYIVHGVKIYLSGFSKLAPPTFKGNDNFEVP